MPHGPHELRYSMTRVYLDQGYVYGKVEDLRGLLYLTVRSQILSIFLILFLAQILDSKTAQGSKITWIKR